MNKTNWRWNLILRCFISILFHFKLCLEMIDQAVRAKVVINMPVTLKLVTHCSLKPPLSRRVLACFLLRSTKLIKQARGQSLCLCSNIHYLRQLHLNHNELLLSCRTCGTCQRRGFSVSGGGGGRKHLSEKEFPGDAARPRRASVLKMCRCRSNGFFKQGCCCLQEPPPPF